MEHAFFKNKFVGCRSLSSSRGTNGVLGDEEDSLTTQLSENEYKKKMKDKKSEEQEEVEGGEGERPG